MTTKRCVRGLRGAVVAMAAMVLAAGSARAQVVTVDRAAGFIIFPKVVSDPAGLFTPGLSVDTVIQLTNTSSTATTLLCFYVDATSHCTNGGSLPDPVGGACRTGVDCRPGGVCAPQWSEVDFSVQLTHDQPVAWQASTGLQTTGLCTKILPTDPVFPELGQPCSSMADCGAGQCTSLPVGNVPPLSPGVFQGELKCIQVNSTTANLPVNRNDLIGNATIYRVSAANGFEDTREYNAIGIQAVLSDGTTQNNTSLCLGTNSLSAECSVAEYAQCPSNIILDHYFDFATPAGGGQVFSDVTFVPCSENLEVDGTQPVTQLQFLVFNEFEQRFSTSTRLDCFLETQLSRIDRLPGQEASSIFSVFVQGTLTGQTRVRPVQNNQPGVGNGVLALLEEFHNGIDGVHSAAFNVNYTGVTTGRGDFVRYTP